MVVRDPTIDKPWVKEIALYAVNDSTVYRQSLTPIVRNLAIKTIKGTFNKTLSYKAYEYAVKLAIERYSREFKMKVSLNPATRAAASKEIAGEMQSELEYTVREMRKKKSAGLAWQRG
jgi:hypothetical protein